MPQRIFHPTRIPSEISLLVSSDNTGPPVIQTFCLIPTRNSSRDQQLLDYVFARRVPTSKSSKAKALAYIHECEKEALFQNFEEQVLEFLSNFWFWNPRQKPKFVQYVILEVAVKNTIALYPPRDPVDSLINQCNLARNRAACMLRFGVNPMYFAETHHEMISNALVNAEISLTFRHFV